MEQAPHKRQSLLAFLLIKVLDAAPETFHICALDPVQLRRDDRIPAMIYSSMSLLASCTAIHFIRRSSTEYDMSAIRASRLERLPCFSPFMDEMARPRGVTGPRDFRPFAWLAAIFAWDVMTITRVFPV